MALCVSSGWFSSYFVRSHAITGYYVVGGIILVLSILIGVFDKQIVKWLTPATNWMHE
jgi:hypothetical protein